MSLQENIKARRQELKLSQDYIADQLGVSRQAVSKWETGKSMPSAQNLADLAAILEISLSELVGSQPNADRTPEQETAEKQEEKERLKNAKMLVGRWGGVVLLNAGWDGYSSGLYSMDFPYYWLAILAAGLVLLFITSRDMSRKHRMEKLQIAVGAAMIVSVFFLPQMLPAAQTGINYFLADIVTAVCAIVLNLKYWRHIWPCKKREK